MGGILAYNGLIAVEQRHAGLWGARQKGFAEVIGVARTWKIYKKTVANGFVYPECPHFLAFTFIN